MSELFKGTIINLHILTSSCFLISRHEHVLNFISIFSRPNSLLSTAKAFVVSFIIYTLLPCVVTSSAQNRSWYVNLISNYPGSPEPSSCHTLKQFLSVIRAKIILLFGIWNKFISRRHWRVQETNFLLFTAFLYLQLCTCFWLTNLLSEREFLSCVTMYKFMS